MARIKRRPFRFWVVLMLTAASLTMFIDAASAVHDANIIELDSGTAGANLVDSAAGNNPTDWRNVFDASGNPIQANLPVGTAATAFVQDFTPGNVNAPDATYHEPSNKDQQVVNPAAASAGWGCGTASNPTDKNEILNAYALAARVQPNTGAPASDVGDLIVYVGGERFDNEGTAFMGVWFFQAPVNCNTQTGDFEGAKTNGDILIIIDFSSGGSDVGLNALVWHPCNAGPNPLPKSQCKDPAKDAGYFEGNSQGGDCAGAGGSDNLCTTVNRAQVTTTWPSQDKDLAANTLDVSEFFESGFNFTDLFAAGNPGSEPCISTFMMETRSSDTLTGATLKDFALDDFDTCVDVTAHKYHDTNANGVDDGASDPPLQGWTLFIDKDLSGTLTNGDISGVTGANGNVTFSNVQGGASLVICEVLQANWINSDPGGGTPADPDGSTLCEDPKIAGSPGIVDFGNYQPASKSGVKFRDDDNSGAQNGAEPGLGGVWIHLFGTDGYGTAVHKHVQSTAGTGAYTFTGLIPGSYTVCESIPDGFAQTAPSSGPACGSHGAGNGPGESFNPAPPAGSGFGIAFTLTSGENEINNNFGNTPLHKIIVLVCHQATNTLVASSVTLNSNPSQSSTTLGPNQGPVSDATLCGITAGSFSNRPHGNQPTMSTNIPSSGSGSGH